MTPNPHPASGNGDELAAFEAAERGAYRSIGCTEITVDNAQAASKQIARFVVDELSRAGLLKLSADDAAELEEYRNLKKYAASLCQRTYLELHAENEQLREALATPAPSPRECPKCGSPDPKKHPAVQFEGEVQICDHSFHAPSTEKAEGKR